LTSNLFLAKLGAVSTAAEPSTPKGRATRARLLGAARELAIAQTGRLEIAQVAEAASVVPSLVHRYFGSKAGLLCSLIDDYYDRFHAAVFALDLNEQGSSWLEREHLRLAAGVRFHYAEPFAAVLFGPLARDPEAAQREADRIQAIVSRAARSIRKAQRAGELPLGVDPALAGAAMFGAMRQAIAEALTRAARPAPERVIALLWRLVVASVGAEVQRAGTAGRSRSR